MISSSLRSTGPFVLALTVSGVLAGCGGASTAVSAPSASTPAASPAAAVSPVAEPSAPTSSVTPGATSAATTAGSGATSPSAHSAAAAPSAGDCPSLALVRTTLGLAVGAPTANAGALDVVVCSYPKDGNPSAVIVRVQEGQTAAGFTAAKAGFAKSGQKAVDVPDMFDGAYRSELGTTAAGPTRTLVVLRGSTEVLVTARTSFDGLTRLTHTMLD